MKKKKIALMIASTIIWAAVIIGSAVVLKGTVYKENVNRILYIGVLVHITLFSMVNLWVSSSKQNKGKAAIGHGLFIILSAVIWGAVMIFTSVALKGTEFKEEISRIIQGASAAHLLFIWAPIGIIFNKEKEQMEREKQE